MKEPDIKLGSRILIGAIAGFVGTLAMTATMRRLSEALPSPQREALPPPEIADAASAEADDDLPEEASKDITTAAHFAYGAASGALLGVANVTLGPVSGGLAGLGLWLGSYMGWVPGAGLTKPAPGQPRRHKALMLAAHVVWGVATARAMRELVARTTPLRGGPDKDADRPKG